jgi:hypothetical protein
VTERATTDPGSSGEEDDMHAQEEEKRGDQHTKSDKRASAAAKGKGLESDTGVSTLL